jgi:[acyl-carrier-protein] S-malonyltransferase
MGRALVEGGFQSSLLQLAEEAAIPLERLLVSGTAEELRPTEVAQPALFYTGVALAELLMQGGLAPTAAAGHSLGEYCAVVAAGGLTAADGMGLVLERGRLMGEARDGSMAAVLGLEITELEALCLQVDAAGECCVVANDNTPGQVVVSGSRAGVETLTGLARDAGARRVVQLNVGGAFHSPLMAQAAKAFASLLDQVQLREPKFPVAAGVTGTLSRSAADIREGLRDQLTGRVRWVEVVQTLAGAGAETFWECGPGTTLAGLGKRILPAALTISVDTPERAAEALAGTLSPKRRSQLAGEA